MTTYRGAFHFSAPRGWLNDPNGLSWFNGRAHLFYQHNPHDSVWGSMHWGHAVTQDLLTWTHLPPALAPDQTYDADGCFSGGAADAGDGRHVLMYTGHLDPEPGNEARRFETQCLAFGDGRTYQKAAGNPVIDGRHLPPGASRGDFRDPKLWREGGVWYCLAANRAADGNGQLLLFASEDLTAWRYVGTPMASGGRLGGMWECPDLSRVGGQDLLIWSVMDEPAREGAYQNVASVVASAGRLERATGVFTAGPVHELDYGPDFYAPQTLTHPDGRVLLIAWMQMWKRSNPTHALGLGWSGQMTLPRELSVRGGRVLQTPVRELAGRRGAEVRARLNLGAETSVPGVEGQHLDLELAVTRLDRAAFTLRCFVGPQQETLLTYDPVSRWMTLDRRRSGLPLVSLAPSHPEAEVYRARVEAPGGRLHLRIVLDRSSLEVFAQGGSTVMTATVYPDDASRGVRFGSTAPGPRLQLSAWPL